MIPYNAMTGGLELMHMNVPVDKLLCETRRVFQALGEAADEALATHGLSARERVLLRMLAREDGPVTVSALARTTLTPVKDATLALATLHSAGWLELRGDSPDAAQATVALNQHGRALWHEVLTRERALLERLEGAVDEEAVRSTLTTLRLVRRLLERPAMSLDGKRQQRTRGTTRFGDRSRPDRAVSFQPG